MRRFWLSQAAATRSWCYTLNFLQELAALSWCCARNFLSSNWPHAVVALPLTLSSCLQNAFHVTLLTFFQVTSHTLLTRRPWLSEVVRHTLSMLRAQLSILLMLRSLQPAPWMLHSQLSQVLHRSVDATLPPFSKTCCTQALGQAFVGRWEAGVRVCRCKSLVSLKQRQTAATIK